ncbi:hypothetical protein BDEG_24956 [Batrachochytrium dendrobatidis JEL423]|uniref:Hyaluronan/mRNA-binding protein domain-containing protein n=1 Tax=Batrachochytrium dendrobatidis (strain JEL423) TaxID=403673 RepID=A0A177WNR5_BATDL|nr:hypothetical protein BDEG_24956 [Batrachochytrium dendrobatidis JEL423]
MTRTKRTSGFSVNDRRSGENAYMDVKKNGAGRGNWGKALDQTAIDEACYRASMPGSKHSGAPKKGGAGKGGWGQPGSELENEMHHTAHHPSIDPPSLRAAGIRMRMER